MDNDMRMYILYSYAGALLVAHALDALDAHLSGDSVHIQLHRQAGARGPRTRLRLILSEATMPYVVSTTSAALRSAGFSLLRAGPWKRMHESVPPECSAICVSQLDITDSGHTCSHPTHPI